MPAFFLAAVSLYLYSGPFTAIKQNVVIPSLRASAVTLSLFIEHLFGDSASPFLIGVVSDWLHSLTAALLVLSPALLVAAAIAAAAGLAHIERDAQRMEATWARHEPEPAAAPAG
jgi:hypothetical protein